MTPEASTLRPAEYCDEWHPGVALADGECPECAAAFDRLNGETR